MKLWFDSYMRIGFTGIIVQEANSYWSQELSNSKESLALIEIASGGRDQLS